MGERVEPSALVGGAGHGVQHRLERCVAALRRMVDDGWFGAHEDTIGMEVEFDLVEPLGPTAADQRRGPGTLGPHGHVARAVSSTRGFDAAAPAPPGRSTWCAVWRSAGSSESRRCMR